MSLSVIIACCLVGTAAFLTAYRRRPSRRRLARLYPKPSQTTESTSERPRQRQRLDLRRLSPVLGGTAVAVGIGGWFGVLAGVAAVAALHWAVRRLPTSQARRRRLAEVGELPLAADLLAVALRSGAPMTSAVMAVAEALPGPLAERLRRVARLLQLGATPAEAWEEFTTLPSGQRFAAAAVRSAEHGSALAGALGRLADDLRAERAVAVEAAARRCGVLIVLPLALCFLPAFILAGLVPVIVAVLGDVLSIEKGVL